MTDDLSRIVGKLETMQDVLEKRLDRQDQDRHDMHEDMRTEVRAVAVQAGEAATWIKSTGQPMAEAWFAQQQLKKDRGLVNKGRAMTWAKVSGVSMLLITGIGWLGKDAVAAVLRKVANLLG